MKKKARKLELNRETIRNLTRNDLIKIAGGSSSECTFPRSCCASCPNWCERTGCGDTVTYC